MQNQSGSSVHGLVRFWANGSCLEASWCAKITGPGFWLNASGLLPVSIFRLGFLHRWSRSRYAKPAWIRWILADCVRFWPNGHSPEACWGARVIWPPSGQCFRADPDQMWIGSGMFTGNPPDNEPAIYSGSLVAE